MLGREGERGNRGKREGKKGQRKSEGERWVENERKR